MAPIIRPVVLSGGSGTRLWPLSRSARPKQFLSLEGRGPSLFQQTLHRLAAPLFDAPCIICNHEHRFLAAEQAREAGVTPQEIILEPQGRNTAPAALVAALHAAGEDPHRLVLLLPSDHAVEDVHAFADAVAAGVDAARQGRIVTFGVKPSRPETGYGYLETAPGDAPLEVLRFTEKPASEVAREYLRSGRHFWNAGIFLFSAEAMIAAFREHAPHFLAPCMAALKEARRDLDFLRLAEEPWRDCPADSLDYAVMEHAGNVRCVPLEAGWSDLGSWTAVWDMHAHDAAGNAASGDVLLHEARNCYAHSTEKTCLTLLGVEDVIAVATRDAVLVAARDRAQEVGAIVRRLQEQGREEALFHARVHRPWGWYEGLERGERYQVKMLMIRPGARLSLQSHHHRAEHWVVVRGTVRVTNGEEVFLLTENESTYIPIGVRHRLENPGKLPAIVIEVQSGGYLGEDDIVRIDDDYGRKAAQ